MGSKCFFEVGALDTSKKDTRRTRFWATRGRTYSEESQLIEVQFIWTSWRTWDCRAYVWGCLIIALILHHLPCHAQQQRCPQMGLDVRGQCPDGLGHEGPSLPVLVGQLLPKLRNKLRFNAVRGANVLGELDAPCDDEGPLLLVGALDKGEKQVGELVALGVGAMQRDDTEQHRDEGFPLVDEHVGHHLGCPALCIMSESTDSACALPTHHSSLITHHCTPLPLGTGTSHVSIWDAGGTYVMGTSGIHEVVWRGRVCVPGGAGKMGQGWCAGMGRG